MDQQHLQWEMDELNYIEMVIEIRHIFLQENITQTMSTAEVEALLHAANVINTRDENFSRSST